MTIPALTQTSLHPRGETLDRQWVGRRILHEAGAKQTEKSLGLLCSQPARDRTEYVSSPAAPTQLVFTRS